MYVCWVAMADSDLKDVMEDIFLRPLSLDEDSGSLVLIYGPPVARKTEFSLRIAFEAAGRGAIAHYFDINISLTPYMFVSLTEKEREVPLRVYRPRSLREVEKVLEYLSFKPQTSFPQAIMLNSLMILRRTVAVRDFQGDPLYLFSLLKKFSSSPRKLAVVVVESNVQRPTSLSLFGTIGSLIDLAVRIDPPRDQSTSLTFYHTPFEAPTQSFRVRNVSFSFT